MSRRSSASAGGRPRPTDKLVNCNALLGDVLLVEDVVGALARERLIETKLTAGRERYVGGLCLAYRVAQVCHADARDHPRVAKDGGRIGEVVEESNS
jgi:hypothetical protein